MKNLESKIVSPSNLDEINLSNVSFSEDMYVSGKSKTSRKSLYKGTDKMTTDEKKSHRRILRRDLNNFVSSILGRDRTEDERKHSISEFILFYKKNWIVTDFKIETFSEKTNENDLRNYRNLLSVVSKAIGK